MNLKQKFRAYQNNTTMKNYSYVPAFGRGFDVFNNKDKDELLNHCDYPVYFVGLTNNKITNKAIYQAKKLGLLCFGRWTDKNNKVFNDVSIITNSYKKAMKLANKYNQQAILKVSNNEVREIYLK